MTCNGSLKELARQIDASIVGELAAEDFFGISTDSRNVAPGNVFVALSGDHFDGHEYVANALERGAIAAIVSRKVDSARGIQLVVPDPLGAYQTIARWWRSQFSIPIIAITGSAGKTSTKEMLAAALGCFGKVLKTEKNYNNDIGVPLTLLQLDESHRFAAIEMAMRGPGEIARLATTALPTHGVIVNVGTAHIGRLGSKRAIARAKCELLEHLDPKSGVAILNGEDELLLNTSAQIWSGEVRKFGFAGAGLPSRWFADPPRIVRDGHLFPVPLPGRHQGLNYAAAIEVVDSLGLDLSVLATGLTLPNGSSGRNQRYGMPDGIEILDETYNAAPEAVVAALELLCESGDSRQCWAVLGPMRELGQSADELYGMVGKAAAKLGDRGLHLCLFDPDAEMTALVRQVPAARVRCFTQQEELADWLSGAVGRGDRLLFKAARSVRIENVMQQFVRCRYPDWELPGSN